MAQSSQEQAVEVSEDNKPILTFEEVQQSLLGLYHSKEADIFRYERFLATLLVNALKNPAGITADLVAFLCDAALKNYTVDRAINKWEAKQKSGAVDLERVSI